MNVQAVVRAYLADALPDASVRVVVPNPRPERFVLVRREGGARIDRHRDNRAHIQESSFSRVTSFVWHHGILSIAAAGRRRRPEC